MRTQVALFGVAVAVLVAVRASLPWLLGVLALIMIAIAAEFFNGALEALLDRLHPGHDPEIGAAKDMSSAAVLIVNLAVATAFGIALVATLG